MASNHRHSRRHFLKLTLAGAVAGMGSRVAWGGKLVPLDESDPMAQALAYHADASSVDPSKHSAFRDGSTCANCAQYKGTDAQDNGACALFPGKSVRADGWCKTWVKQ